MRTISRTLAIETSCDDTSVAVVSFDWEKFHVEKMMAYTQLEIHKQYGWVVPELAARSHMEKILPLVEALWWNKLRDEIDSISVTAYPWLPWALVVWVTAAHTLWALWEKPVNEVNHIMGHVFSILADRSLKTMELPYMCLTVSGGHNDIYLVEENTGEVDEKIDDEVWHKRKHIPLWWSTVVWQYRVTKCAQTMDDAAWEVFDKVARMLWWPYPGGKWVEEQTLLHEWESSYTFTKPKMPDDQFSLSWLKSQVHNTVYKIKAENLTEDIVRAICWSFVEAITATLSMKFQNFVEQYDPATVWLVWWVSANKKLRESLVWLVWEKSLLTPEKFVYCTDNAGMIWVVWLLMSNNESK